MLSWSPSKEHCELSTFSVYQRGKPQPGYSSRHNNISAELPTFFLSQYEITVRATCPRRTSRLTSRSQRAIESLVYAHIFTSLPPIVEVHGKGYTLTGSMSHKSCCRTAYIHPLVQRGRFGSTGRHCSSHGVRARCIQVGRSGRSCSRSYQNSFTLRKH